MKNVTDASDLQGCERELLRMFNIIRSVFFDSKSLLVEEFTRKVSDGKKKVSQADKLMSLFATIIEEITSSKQHEAIVAETVITMINVAS